MSVGIGIACISCQTYLVPLKNDIYVLEQHSDGSPYKIWNADLVHCPDCERRFVTGYGLHACSEHYMDNFEKFMELVVITIKGCPKGAADCPSWFALREQWEAEQ